MFRRASLICLSLSLFIACGGRVTPPPDFSDDPAPYHERFAQRRAQVKSLSGELRLEIWEGDERVRARQLFAAAPPKLLRIDTLSPFEQPISTLIINAQQIALHDVNQRRFRVGLPSAEHLGQLSRLHIDPASLASLLGGQPPLIQREGGELTWDAERGLYKLTLRSPEGRFADRQELWIRPGELTIAELRMYQGEALKVKLQLTDYTNREPRLPQRMRFELPERAVRIEVKLKDFALNPDLPQEAFMITVPPGLSPEPILSP